MNARTISDADVRALAVAVTDALAGRPACRFTDVQGVAAYAGLSDSWVRANADALGVVRIGDGPKPRLRFDLRAVDEYMKRAGSGPTDPQPARKRKRRQPRGSSAELLPVRGAAA